MPEAIRPEVIKPEVIKIGPGNPEQTLIDRAVEILRGGGVIAYPTETFYGLGAHAGNAEAVEKIFIIKGRPFANPIALIMGNEENMEELVREVSPASRRLMEAFWPGALTLVFHASSRIPSSLTAGAGANGTRRFPPPLNAAI